MNTAEINEADLIDELPKLYELQLLDLRLGELLDQRAAIDDGSGKTVDLEQAKGRLAEVNDKLADLRARQVDRKLERGTLETRRERNQHRLWQESPAPEEAEALQKDLESTAERLDKIALELQDLSDRVEPLEHQAEDEKRTVTELETELADVTSAFSERVKGIDDGLREVYRERQAKALEVPEVLLHRYEMIRERRGDPGIVKITEEVCTACNTQLSSYMMRQLHLRQRVQQCENCNTILFWAGETNPDFWLDEAGAGRDSLGGSDGDD